MTFREIFENTNIDRKINQIMKKYGYKFDKIKIENKQSVWKVYKNPNATEQTYSDAVNELSKLNLIIVNTGNNIEIKIDYNTKDYIIK